MKYMRCFAALALCAAGGAAPAQISADVVRIGFITDLSGVYADIDGPGGVEAIRMAIADAGPLVYARQRPAHGPDRRAGWL